MIQTYGEDYDVTVIQAWGMTEMSPLGTVCRLRPEMKDLDYERQLDIMQKLGAAIPGQVKERSDEPGESVTTTDSEPAPEPVPDD